MNGFTDQPQASVLNNRLYLQHGPISLIVEAIAESTSDAGEVTLAYRQATIEFNTVLEQLSSELTLLRKPVSSERPTGSIARSMHRAAMRYENRFITPMVAVAGAVADHILTCAVVGRKLQRASVNNGGDIALYLGHNSGYEVGICAHLETGQLAGTIEISPEDCVRGIATSGWRGRSFSFGIADAVTVLASDAVTADAAATIIANEVTVESSRFIKRLPASELLPDSDLGEQPVTVEVSNLPMQQVEQALLRGTRCADQLVHDGLINSAFLCLDNIVRTVGTATAPKLERLHEDAPVAL